jgi:hypothetical protein
LNVPFLGEITTDIGDMAKSIATYLVGQDESWVNAHRCSFKASELELNRSFGFGLRSLVVDVHAMTLPKGYGTVLSRRRIIVADGSGCRSFCW